MAGIIPNAIKDAELTTILGQLPWSSSVMIHLFSNNFVPNNNSVIGDFTEANFVGYAAQPVTPWGVASGGSSGASNASATVATWNPGALVTPQDCYGWYATDGSGNLVGSGAFAVAPKNMGGTVTLLTIQLVATLS